MDESVLKAIAKWPNVPDVFGWLSLDRRGNWLLRNDPIRNETVIDFINRNFLADQQGRWFFQNGPQRVFVALAYTPFVLRTSLASSKAKLVTQTGAAVTGATGAWIDENGDILIGWPSGIGVICDRDLAEVICWLTDSAGKPVPDAALEHALTSTRPGEDTGLWIACCEQRLPVERVDSREVPARFGFDACPRPAAGQPEC